MKQINPILYAVAILVTVILPANADNCTTIGLTVGTACTSGTKGNNGSPISADSSCTSTSAGCKIALCNSVCSCVKSCPSSPAPCNGLTCPQMDCEATTDSSGRQKCYFLMQNTTTCACTRDGRTGYQCGPGFYKSGGTMPMNITCSPCTSPGTSDAGATAITQCYIPKDTTGSDSTGSYKYTDKCYYAN